MHIKHPYRKMFCLLLILGSCLEPYEPPVMKGNVDYLVVDGFIDSNTGSASVVLTRANVLTEIKDPLPEVNAQVSIEDNTTGTIYSLADQGNGRYSSSMLTPDPLGTYTLHIQTENGSDYRSEPVQLKQSPAIDSVTWKPTPDGVEVYVNTHDASAGTRYYRWEFEETWEYNSVYESSFKRVDGLPVLRNENERIYVCWRTLLSSDILLSSSLRLTEDRISDYLINFVPQGSIKLSRTYSILVRQYALSEDAFNYWQQLQKTTESLGGLFDPQPARITG